MVVGDLGLQVAVGLLDDVGAHEGPDVIGVPSITTSTTTSPMISTAAAAQVQHVRDHDAQRRPGRHPQPRPHLAAAAERSGVL